MSLQVSASLRLLAYSLGFFIPICQFIKFSCIMLKLEYKPRFKCGAEIALGAGIAAAGGLIGTALQGDYNTGLQNASLDAQRQENEKNRKYNAEQAELARQFQNQQRLASQDFLVQEWNRQFAAQNEYNSPKEQYGRLLEGHLNPGVYFGGSGSVQASSAPSVSAPSASSPAASFSGGVNVAPPYIQNIPQLMSSAGEMLSSLAQAGKTNIESKYLGDKMAKEIDLITTQLGINEETKQSIQFANAMAKAKVPYAGRQAFEEYLSLQLDNYVKAMTGQKFEKDQDLIEAQTKVQKALESVHGENAMLLKTQWTQLQSSYGLRMQNLRADTANKSASAALAGAQALTENELRDVRKYGLELQNSISENERNFSTTTFFDRVEKLKSSLGTQKLEEILRGLEVKDKNAYTTLQRVFFGHNLDGDVKNALKLFMHQFEVAE